MESKRELRLRAKETRNSLGATERCEKSKAICAQLFRIINDKNAENIFTYIAVGSEVNLEYLLSALYKSEKEYCISFPGSMEKGEMNALKPFSNSDFTMSAYGISVPKEECSLIIQPEELDIIIVPLLLFDDCKHRLGYGGGYYDRYLTKAENAIKIGVGFEEQKHEKLPHEPHDFTMDMIVSDKKIYL